MSPEELKQINLSKLPPSLLAKLAEWDKNSPAKQQLQHLGDIADMTQEVITLLDAGNTDNHTLTTSMGALLVDIRETLKALNAKEAPEIPDYAKPVVESVGKLEKRMAAALKAIDVKPEVNVSVPDIQAPAVDLKGVEKLLKTDIPKAFKGAIENIPKTEVPAMDWDPLLIKLDVVLDQLAQIETAARLKPQAPSSMKVTNPDGSPISLDTTGLATETAQDTGNASLASIDTKVDALTTPSDTQPVSAVSLPLPSGAATAANQTAGNSVLTAIQTAVEILDNAVAGSELQVDVLTAPQPTPFSTLLAGEKTVANTATPEALASSTSCNYVLIQAKPGNTSNCFVGNSTNQKVELQPGQAWSFGIDNLSKIYVDVGTNGDGVNYTGA